MDKINISCIFCGETFLENLTKKESICPKCKRAFDTSKGSKYYKSLLKVQKQENKKIINEIYNQIDLLLDKAQYYLDNEKYEMCEETLNKLLNLNDSDRRIYLLFVYLKTKNFTDLKDKSHYPYLERLIELSNEEEKKQLRKIYSTYYKKSNLTDEELDEYNFHLANNKKQNLESALKDGIPLHYENARKYRVFKVLSIIFTIIFTTLIICHFSFKIDVLLYVASAFSALLLGCILMVINLKPRLKIYDALLDFYDEFDNFNLKTTEKLQTIKHLSTISQAFLNNGSNYSINALIYLFVNDLVTYDNDKVLEFLLKYKVFTKYIKK